MDGRTLEEQEKDINEVLRKAFRTPPKSAPRREAFKRLIELAHSPYPKLKVTVAQNIKVFVKDFPELEDDAINAVYDLCEDQVTKVRVCGYRAISDVSKEQPKWVKRNADVLVQLLQSDEPDEVSFVKRMLSEHLDMDPAVTLGVLCDQIVPPDEPLDEEEQAIRTRLRSLVLSFVIGEAKRAVDRHTSTPGSAAEETLVTGLLRAVDKLMPPDIDIIVKDVLLTLPSFKPNSPRGKQLLDVVLEKAKESLKTDLNPDNLQSSLTHSRYYLGLASFIALQKRVAHYSHLLRFYFSSQLAAKPILVRLSLDARAFVLSSIADILDTWETSPLEGANAGPGTQDGALCKQIPDQCNVYLQVFTEDMGLSVDQRPWKACRVFLKTCLDHLDEHNWRMPSHFAVVLQKLNVMTQEDPKHQDLQNLIRSLQPAGKPTEPARPAPPPTNPPKGIAASSSTTPRRIMNIKRKHDDKPAGLPPRPQTIPPVMTSVAPPLSLMSRTSQQCASTSQTRPLGISIAGAATRNGRPSTAQEEEPRVAKRAKKGGGSDETPSLLSRLAAQPAGTNGRSSSNPAGEGRRSADTTSSAQPPRQRQQDINQAPIVGFSIKGAARVSSGTTNGRSSPAPRTSLLARLQDEQGGTGGKRRRKARVP